MEAEHRFILGEEYTCQSKTDRRDYSSKLEAQLLWIACKTATLKLRLPSQNKVTQIEANRRFQ